MPTIRTESDLYSLFRAASGLAVLDAWVSSGAFHALLDGPKGVAELPGEQRALELTAPILANMGLLVGDTQRWTLSRAARELVEAGALTPRWSAQTYLGDMSRMRDVLADGGPMRDAEGASKVTTGGVLPDDPERTAKFMDMLWRTSEKPAAETLQWTRDRLNSGAHLLDIGGGHGRYARAFVDAGFQATVFDLPVCIDIARERHGDALSYVAGNFETDDLEGPYDAVLLSNIVHGEPPGANSALLHRIRKVLKPRGLLIVKDMFIDEHGDNPESAVFFGLTMLNYTRAGRSYRLRDFTAMCAEAGFVDVDVASLDGYQLIFARRR